MKQRIDRLGSHLRWLVCLPAIAATVVAVGAEHASSAAHPDWTGVWTTYREGGRPAFGFPRAQNLPLTPEGKKKVDEYRALVGPTSDNPGAHCLGSGMPESMTFSGAYPMEIIQRPEQITIIY